MLINKVESGADFTEIQWLQHETLWEKEIAASNITRERFVRIDGSRILTTTIFTSDATLPMLLVDDRFVEKPIVTEPGGLLIDQAATTNSWGQAAGIRPENFINASENFIAVPTTNFGWQRGTFIIRGGEPILIPNDRDTLSGSFEVIGFNGNKWQAVETLTKDGRTIDGAETVQRMSVGFSLPLIVKNGQIVDQMDIWKRGDPRALADPRNWVNLAAGKEVDPKFWTLIRKFLPVNPSAARRVTETGRFAVVRSEGVNPKDVAEFNQIIIDSGLQNNWQIREDSDQVVRAIVCAVFPPNRIPSVGIGFDHEGKLIVTTIDGRQPDSTGATINELAEIMKAKGAVFAGFGAAGGDVCVLAKNNAEIEILNSPANVNPQSGQRVTRPVPSLLVLA